jgi:hypothetical protein
LANGDSDRTQGLRRFVLLMEVALCDARMLGMTQGNAAVQFTACGVKNHLTRRALRALGEASAGISRIQRRRRFALEPGAGPGDNAIRFRVLDEGPLQRDRLVAPGRSSV